MYSFCFPYSFCAPDAVTAVNESLSCMRGPFPSYNRYTELRQLLAAPVERRPKGWQATLQQLDEEALLDMRRLTSCINGRAPARPSCVTTNQASHLSTIGKLGLRQLSPSRARPAGCCSAPLQLQLQLLHRPALIAGSGAPFSRCYPLDGASMARSLVHLGDGFKSFVQRVARGENVTIVTLGSSVASGAGTPVFSKNGISPAASSHERFVAWLRHRYPPGDQIRFHLLAIAGATSAARVAFFEDVRAANPDLIIWDYSSNDYPDKVPSGHAQALLRSSIEKLTRLCLQLPSHPEMLFLGLARSLLQDRTVWALQAHALEPVVRHYHQTLVSYSDAVVPEYSTQAIKAAEAARLLAPNPRHAVHLLWWVHQLIADCMSYAWVVAEQVMSPAQAISERKLPEARWADPEVESLEACSGGWRTKLFASGESESTFAPVDKGGGWHFEKSSKPGWRFNASDRTRQSSSGVLAPITFEVEFGLQPKLVLSVMRSYANFGRAVVWIGGDEGEQAMLQMQRHHRRFESWCDNAFCSDFRESKRSCFGFSKQANFLKFKSDSKSGNDPIVYDVHRMKGPRGFPEDDAYADCERYHLGDLRLPHVLDGHWTDQSSQAFHYGIQNGFTRAYDANITTVESREGLRPLSDLIANADDFVGYTAAIDHPLARPGRRRVHIAMINEAQNEQRPLFKLLGVMTC
jgi:hypothetical protein